MRAKLKMKKRLNENPRERDTIRGIQRKD